MSLELLVQVGLLLGAVVPAFAISSLVGMVVARLWATPRPPGGAPDEWICGECGRIAPTRHRVARPPRA